MHTHILITIWIPFLKAPVLKTRSNQGLLTADNGSRTRLSSLGS